MPASALYVGHVRHRRMRPHAHGFRYRMAQLYVDLDELPTLLQGRWLWSLERRNLATGCATLCVGGGMGIATVIERV